MVATDYFIVYDGIIRNENMLKKNWKLKLLKEMQNIPAPVQVINWKGGLLTMRLQGNVWTPQKAVCVPTIEAFITDRKHFWIDNDKPNSIDIII